MSAGDIIVVLVVAASLSFDWPLAEIVEVDPLLEAIWTSAAFGLALLVGAVVVGIWAMTQ